MIEMERKPENVREALDRLLVYNDALHNPSPAHLSGTAVVDDTVKDVQDSNYEMLANLADLLGMQELYEADDAKITKL
ncbi:hypothetical protein [Lactiplantibacillus paraxiangfangensis]|uniref:hypothetical protein n=1 Tax=Lactiplantibacillus paraxiangfangensis TaxID=3076224 RepID=UPI0030C68B3B